VRPDGKALWVQPMPDYMEASPMLSPDGTLYAVCRDKRLYAFRDPPGDFDRDGDVDLVDFAQFQLCYTGPREAGTASLLEPGCELADFDNDWDTDLVDFGEFTLAYTGS
jgi:hypothetical protein